MNEALSNYARARARMCLHYDGADGCYSFDVCPLRKAADDDLASEGSCLIFELQNPEIAVTLTQIWAKDHPEDHDAESRKA